MPKVGDTVSIIGHPGQLPFTYMTGTVAAIRDSFPFGDEERDGPILQVQSGLYKGNSGGPIINQDGEIVGIASFIVEIPEQGFCTASPAIKRFVLKAYNDHIL